MNRNDEILKVALELQERDSALKERDRDLEEKARAASEVGLDPQFIAKATEIVDTRLAIGKIPETSPRRTGTAGMILAALAAGLVAAVTVSLMLPWKEDIQPWRYTFDAPTFVLDKNPETVAGLSTVTVPDHGAVALLHVERFAAGPDGNWRANVDITDIPTNLEAFTELRLKIRGDGGMPVARVYLDNGSERWRSAPITVRGDWGVYWGKFRQMDHQVREDGKWRTVDWVAPTHASAISVKTGTFMNDEKAVGDVMIDDIELR